MYGIVGDQKHFHLHNTRLDCFSFFQKEENGRQDLATKGECKIFIEQCPSV